MRHENSNVVMKIWLYVWRRKYTCGGGNDNDIKKILMARIQKYLSW